MTTFIKSKEKKIILKELEEQYGITDLPHLLIQGGKQRLRAFSGHLSKEEILELGELTRVETIGMYLISRRDSDLRLNFDAISLLRDQIKKNILEINKDQLELWMRGHDLEIEARADERSESIDKTQPQETASNLKPISTSNKTSAEKTGVQFAPEENPHRGIIILKYKNDLVGLGKSNGEKIFNYIPKERKLKTPLPKKQ